MGVRHAPSRSTAIKPHIARCASFPMNAVDGEDRSRSVPRNISIISSNKIIARSSRVRDRCWGSRRFLGADYACRRGAAASHSPRAIRSRAPRRRGEKRSRKYGTTSSPHKTTDYQDHARPSKFNFATEPNQDRYFVAQRCVCATVARLSCCPLFPSPSVRVCRTLRRDCYAVNLGIALCDLGAQEEDGS